MKKSEQELLRNFDKAMHSFNFNGFTLVQIRNMTKEELKRYEIPEGFYEFFYSENAKELLSNIYIKGYEAASNLVVDEFEKQLKASFKNDY